MLINRNNLINYTNKEKLTYELWLVEYKKRHCVRCLKVKPSPQSCYVCYGVRKTGFSCGKCKHFVYYAEGEVCGGLYDTGDCFCDKCQKAIKNWLDKRQCSCEFSLAGYSAGHPIHGYSSVINGVVKPFFKGSKLWVKLVCRSCEKVIKSFRLGCDCYLEQKKHLCLYNKEQCLNCVIGGYVRPLSEEDLRGKYQDFCQQWQEREEIKAQTSLKQQYKYDGVSYWAECSFCKEEVKGQKTHQGALSRNKVGFWTGDLIDERVVCNVCLRSKKTVKELGIKGIKRQMLYNYRERGLI